MKNYLKLFTIFSCIFLYSLLGAKLSAKTTIPNELLTQDFIPVHLNEWTKKLQKELKKTWSPNVREKEWKDGDKGKTFSLLYIFNVTENTHELENLKILFNNYDSNIDTETIYEITNEALQRTLTKLEQGDMPSVLFTFQSKIQSSIFNLRVNPDQDYLNYMNSDKFIDDQIKYFEDLYQKESEFFGHLADAYSKKAEKNSAYYKKIMDLYTDNLSNKLSLYRLGNIHFRGLALNEKDSEKSLDFYTKAAELGHPFAMINLARSYYHGILTEQDLNKSLSWYKRLLTHNEDLKEFKIKKKIKFIEKELAR